MRHDSTHKLANDMDLELFTLLRKAERLADDSRIKREVDGWIEAALAIRSARSSVRALMHPKDLENYPN